MGSSFIRVGGGKEAGDAERRRLPLGSVIAPDKVTTPEDVGGVGGTVGSSLSPEVATDPERGCGGVESKLGDWLVEGVGDLLGRLGGPPGLEGPMVKALMPLDSRTSRLARSKYLAYSGFSLRCRTWCSVNPDALTSSLIMTEPPLKRASALAIFAKSSDSGAFSLLARSCR